MLTVKEAQNILMEYAGHYESELVNIESASGRIIAGNIVSSVPHPLFNQSAVDGYAFNYDNIVTSANNCELLRIAGEIKAGEFVNVSLGKNEVVRIFTGACVPESCDTIIMQEDVERNDLNIHFNMIPERGSHIRKKGKQIKAGEIALPIGTKMNPASIGFLASLGIKNALVSKLPLVSIIVTGDEFANELNDLNPGKVFETNGIMLETLLSHLGIKSYYKYCEDNKDKLSALVKSETGKNDITIITGGVSVGDYDFTRSVLEKLGFKIIFHKVSQKPGMPLLFAKNKVKSVFGLPGNPRSVLVCFYEYVYPFIQKEMQNDSPFLKRTFLPLLNEFDKKSERSFFLSAKLESKGVVITGEQESHMLSSLAGSDVLVFLSEGKKLYKKGETVEIHILPF